MSATPLVVVIPYCTKDAPEAKCLLEWIGEIQGTHPHDACLMVADAAVPLEQQKEIGAVAKGIFSWAQTMMVPVKPAVNGQYQVPAAEMFKWAAMQIDTTLKWNWLWLEPDCVPLKSGWLSALTEAYNSQPKRFMGALIETDQPGVPKVHLAGCAIYPNCFYQDIEKKKFCDGKTHFDLQWANYVVPGAVNTELLFHRWGAPSDPPTFKAVKELTDGVNVGTLDLIPPSAVLFHRNKDGSLIDLLRNQRAPFHNPDGSLKEGISNVKVEDLVDEAQQSELRKELQEELNPQQFSDDLGITPVKNKGGRPRKVNA